MGERARLRQPQVDDALSNAVESRFARAFAPIALTLIAIVPRLSTVWQGFITSDEPFWVYSAIRFTRALEAHHWGETFQIGHPGVTTMWIGSLGVLWQRWRQPLVSATHLAWVDRVPWIAPENEQLFTHLLPFLAPARVGVVLLTSLGVVGMYLLARRLWDRRAALVGAVLLALDPFLIGLSGLLHVDALAATFLTLSLLAWLCALKGMSTHLEGVSGAKPLGTYLLALLGGLLGGLGILSKSVGVLSLPAVAAGAFLFLLLDASLRKRLGPLILLGLTWVAGAVGALFGVFPAMWVDPVDTLQRMVGLASWYGSIPHRVTFFRGVSGGDPGPLFYPVVLFFRLTPVVLLGLALSLDPLLTGWRSAEANRRRASLWALWLLALGFTLFVSVSSKKFDRYLLPAFPALDLLAGVGWVAAVRRSRRWLFRGSEPAKTRHDSATTGTVFAVVTIALAIAQGAMIAFGWPYYLDVYNPLAGGIKGAVSTLPAGWGEGLEQIARYLNRQENASDMVVAGASPVTLGPLYQGRVLSLDGSSHWMADKILIMALDRQADPQQVANLISGTRLEHVVRVGGQEMLWLYRTQYRAEADYLSRYAAPGDAILCDAPSPFARGATRGDVPSSIYLLTDEDEPQIVGLLNDWTAKHTRLWYLAYPSDSPNAAASPITARAIRQQLDAHAVSLDQVDLGYVTATLYLMPDRPTFAPADPPGEGVAGGSSAGQGSTTVHLRPAFFEDQLAIVGGALLGPPFTADDAAHFRLRWRALSRPQADYAAFIHLVDEAGHLRTAGRGEEWLVDERFWPTSTWEPGEGVERNYSLGFPTGLPPGRYWIVVGLADRGSGEWLPVLDETGQLVGTTAALFPLDVGPAERTLDPDRLRLPHPANLSWEERLTLLGYEMPARASVGQEVILELGWHGMTNFDGDYALRLSLIDADGAKPFDKVLPLSRYPTSSWRPGELIRELYDLTLPAELDGGKYSLAIQVVDDVGAPLRLATGGTEPVPLGELTVSVEERLFELRNPPGHPANYRLGSAIQLLGYDLLEQDVVPGASLSLTLYWQSLEPVNTSYTAFVHLLDRDNRIQGQRDRIPGGGRSPTSGWLPGQIVIDAYTLPVSEEALPGSYAIEVGMYNAKDMARLPVYDAGGNHVPDDRVLLQPSVTVKPR